jgi:hypothetical protein
MLDYHRNVMARTAPATAKERASQAVVEPKNVKIPSFETMVETRLQESVQDAIARLAYGYWLERKGSNEGSSEEDWLRAEREVLGYRSQHS